MPFANQPGQGPIFGVTSYSVSGERNPDSHTDNALENTIAEACQAEDSGIDFFGISESYARGVLGRDCFDVVEAIGRRTTSLRICTSIERIATDDIARRHSQLHQLISDTNGRVEIVLDRDRFAVCAPDTADDTDPEFNANLAEWCRLTDDCGFDVTWIEVTGRSDAVLQAVRYGIPIMLQVSRGCPFEQKPFTDLYRMANTRFGNANTPLGLLSPGFIAHTDEEATDIAFELWNHNLGRATPEDEKHAAFMREVTHGALFVGSPDTVAKKIAATVEHLGIDHFYLRYTCGLLDHENSMKSIELYGTEVIPRVRKLLGVEKSFPS